MAMSFRKTALVGGYCLTGLIGLALEAHAQAELVSQPPCSTNLAKACVTFSASAPPPSVLRSNSITVPGRGRVLASINGTGICSNASSTTKVAIDFSTQLVRDPAVEATGHGNGGARHSFTLDPHANGVTTFHNFNLSSERVFNVPEGTHEFYFKVKIHRHDSAGAFGNPLCHFFNNTMSLLFIPS